MVSIHVFLQNSHLVSLISFVSTPSRVAHFIPDIMPAVSSDPGRISQMVTNTRLLLGVLAKVTNHRGWTTLCLFDSVDECECTVPYLARQCEG